MRAPAMATGNKMAGRTDFIVDALQNSCVDSGEHSSCAMLISCMVA
jgi:hypothetical protein